jgi:hypothetical protein
MEVQSVSVQIKEKELSAFVKRWPWDASGFCIMKVELSNSGVKLDGRYRTVNDFTSTWELSSRGTSVAARLVGAGLKSTPDIPAVLAFGEFRSAIGETLHAIPYLRIDREALYVDLQKLLAQCGSDLRFGLKRISCNKYHIEIDAGPSTAEFPVTPIAVSKTANAIRVIQPYWGNGTWVFDDPAVNLEREPFVCGIPEMIDQLVADIPNARSGFRMLFSESAFPDYQQEFVWKRAEADGNWYALADGSAEGWLCPALFRYYNHAPRRIFVKAEALDSSEAEKTPKNVN